ncbi:MAG TPA: hypothetical protein VIC59_04285 [Gemmatimonadota bacterium]
MPGILRRPVTLAEAHATLERRLAQREAAFLDILARSVYAYPESPYATLLRAAGCEYGDVRRLVEANGLEGALAELHVRGVYLTVEEFKGRRPAVRGSTVVAVDPVRLRNPLVAGQIAARTSGSRGTGTPVLLGLDFVRDCAVNTMLNLEAWGGLGWRKAIWEAPGAGATFRLLKHSSFGAPVEAWFSPIDLAAPGLHHRYRWGARALRWESRLLGVPLPRPQSAPLDDPLPLARWISRVLREGGVPHLFSLTSPAVRLCRAAGEAGLDLRGARIMLSGEPITQARLEAVRAAGMEAFPRYGSVECGPVAYACGRPEAPDEAHLLGDLHALIQPRPGARGGVPADALFITSLRPTAPFVLLNVSMGDRAALGPRACGCPLERLGWTVHLRDIRSFEKLTGQGITFLDTDVVRVLEEVLPERFGGAPTDYQLVEEEEEGGEPVLRLLVHPDVGPFDPSAVAEVFLSALGTGDGGEWMMAQIWRDSGTLRVERRLPLRTVSGKIHHLVARAPQ